MTWQAEKMYANYLEQLCEEKPTPSVASNNAGDWRQHDAAQEGFRRAVQICLYCHTAVVDHSLEALEECTRRLVERVKASMRVPDRMDHDDSRVSHE